MSRQHWTRAWSRRSGPVAAGCRKARSPKSKSNAIGETLSGDGSRRGGASTPLPGGRSPQSRAALRGHEAGKEGVERAPMRTVERKKHLRMPASGTIHGLWLTGTAASPQEADDANASLWSLCCYKVFLHDESSYPRARPAHRQLPGPLIGPRQTKVSTARPPHQDRPTRDAYSVPTAVTKTPRQPIATSEGSENSHWKMT